MKRLIICGKANRGETTADDFKAKGTELWMLGTDARKGADRYFELHGIKVEHKNVTYELPAKVYETGLPINNSISALLVYAWLEGYKDIKLVGCQMWAKHEYQEARPTLAYCIGYIAHDGVKVEWDGLPLNKFYGAKDKAPETETEEEV